MLKGVRKNMIFIQLPKAKCFESAYFVIRPYLENGEQKQGEMIREANRIIGELGQDGKKKRTAKDVGWRVAFLCYGFFGGAAAVSVVWLLTLIFG